MVNGSLTHKMPCHDTKDSFKFHLGTPIDPKELDRAEGAKTPKTRAGVIFIN